MASSTPRRARIAVVSALAVLAAGLVAANAPAQAAAPAAAPAAVAQASDFVDHPGLVPEQPARGYPIILGEPVMKQFNGNCPKQGCDVPREVLATDQVGRYIVSGGNFKTIRLQDGTEIEQPFFTAWNIDTKQIACTQTTFDKPVLSVVPGDTPDTIFVGGKFSKITGPDGVTRTRNRVAKLSLPDCSVVKKFTSPTPSARVDDLAVQGERLFLGGDFNTIGGRSISTVAQLDTTTGSVEPGFSLDFSGGISARSRALTVTPDGSRLVLAGRYGTVRQGGVSVPSPTAVIDISGPTPVLTGHSSSGYRDTNGSTTEMKRLQDASVSPDGSVVGLAYGTATKADYVYLTPTTESATTYRWRHYMRDSSFGIGVSNNAVYVAGHFCMPDAGPGPTEVMSPIAGVATDCTGTGWAGGVWRSHLAALSLTDGTPLTWNAGSESYRGGRVITVTSRGLLVGYDGERTNTIRVGALAFLDFGASAEDVAPPSAVTITAPEPGAVVGTPTTITGTATDDIGVASYRLVLRADDGRYLQANGALGAPRYERIVPAQVDESLSYEVALPVGAFTLEAVAVDRLGKVSATVATRAFTQSGVDVTKPESTIVAPDGVVGENLTISGVASDDQAVASLRARVLDDAGRYLGTDGTFTPGATNLPIAIDTALPAASVGWSVSLGVLPAGQYSVQMRVKDTADNARTPQSIFTVR